MFLKMLKLINFKNYSEAELEFSEKTNCFLGNNGEGKTNLLDSIYYLSFCKSCFNPADSQNIKHEQDFFLIQGTYNKDDTIDKISCLQKRNQRKQFKTNDKEYDRFSDHIGLFPLVIISPSDSSLILEGSDVRRKFLDGLISQFDKTYLDDLLKYNKALHQRNVLLKNFAEKRYFDKTSLEIWDDQLIKPAANIYETRKKCLDELIPVFQNYFNFITNSKENINITFESQLHNIKLKDLLEENIEKDKILRYTTTGIHKDDLSFSIENFPIKKYGSQGQQKSFIISLKLAQFEFIKRIKKFKPILLLDDLFDKLDRQRAEQLIKLVSRNEFGQIFITDTQISRVENILDKIQTDKKIFKIIGGTVFEQKV